MATTYGITSGGASQVHLLGSHIETRKSIQGSSFEYRVWRPSKRLTPNSLLCQPGWERLAELSSCRSSARASRTSHLWVGSQAINHGITASAAIAEKAALPSNTQINPATPTLAEQARTLVEISDEGTLGTVGEDGWPIGTHARFALQEDGNPVLLLHPKAVHTAHVEADARCTLHVQVPSTNSVSQFFLQDCCLLRRLLTLNHLSSLASFLFVLRFQIWKGFHHHSFTKRAPQVQRAHLSHLPPDCSE
jgi:hypothetical protein